jgi:hypothetical protein
VIPASRLPLLPIPHCRTGNVPGLGKRKLFTTRLSPLWAAGVSRVLSTNVSTTLWSTDEARTAWLRSLQKEAKCPESFLDLLGIVRIANGKVGQHSCK